MKRTFTRVAAVLLAVGGLLGTWPGAGTAQDLDADDRQRLYYTAKPAIVLIYIQAQANIQIPTDNGNLQMSAQRVGTGSGLIITPDGFIVTNGHVVEMYHDSNENQLRLELLLQALSENGYFDRVGQQRGQAVSQQEQYQITANLLPNANITVQKSAYAILPSGQSLEARVRQYSPPIVAAEGKVSFPGYNTLESGNDVAILKVEGRDLPTLPLAPADRVAIGQEVFVAGFPGSVLQHDYLGSPTALEASFTRGQVSSLKVTVQGADVIQIDAAVTHGNSGGPVLNGAGEVIGIATFVSINRSTGTIDAGFNFAVPTAAIANFVRAEGIQPTEGLFDRTWDRALGEYYAGQYSAALASFDEVLRIMPGLPDALELSRNAATEIDAGNDAAPGGGGGGGFPTWLLAVLGGGALLVVVGLVMKGGGTATAPAGAGGAIASAPAAAGAIPVVSASRLTVAAGPLTGNRFSIGSGEVKIGRDPSSCQVVLSESSVSREHAVIRPNGGNLMIKNLSGTNPTYVNDRAIQETTLSIGDRIKIGDSVFEVEG